MAPLAAAPSFTPDPVAPENSRAHGLPDGFVLHVGGPAPTKNLCGLLGAMADQAIYRTLQGARLLSLAGLCAKRQPTEGN